MEFGLYEKQSWVDRMEEGISDLTDGFGAPLVDRVFMRYELAGGSGG